ncbi:MAG: hypothetical protein JWP35_1737 [Caulobacter sp.]|nr:hypothetical protein [Caulobacter sp.]
MSRAEIWFKGSRVAGGGFWPVHWKGWALFAIVGAIVVTSPFPWVFVVTRLHFHLPFLTILVVPAVTLIVYFILSWRHTRWSV